MKQSKHIIKAGKFKAECLKLMNDVSKTKKSIIITKRSKPIAKLAPIEEEKDILFGRMKNVTHIKGNIIDPVGENWDADS